MKRLFITFEALGDAVMRCGALRVLATDATLDLAGRPFLSIYGDCPWVRATIDASTLMRRRHPWLDGVIAGRRALAGRLQAEGYDEVICYQRDADRGLRRWLQQRLPAVRLREIPRDHGRHPGHVTEQGADILAGIGLPTDRFDPVPVLDLSSARCAAGTQRLRELAGGRAVCFQPGSALATTPWWDMRRQRLGNPKAVPAASWSALAETLLRSGSASGIVLLGSGGERALAAQVRGGVNAAWRDRVHLDAVGLGVPEMAALVRAAALLVSVDTGPAHVAAAVGARVLVAFGPTDPARFSPRGPGQVRTIVHDIACRPCHGTAAAKRCRDNACLRLLPVGQLATAAEAMLSQPSPPPGAAARPG
jgi:ADP-heptose:LPS heptosyltransferase